MSNYFKKPDSHYTFDFSHSRVRLSVDKGKSKSLSKFDIAWEISYNLSLFCVFSDGDAFSYREYKDLLLNLLHDGDYKNVSIYV